MMYHKGSHRGHQIFFVCIATLLFLTGFVINQEQIALTVICDTSFTPDTVRAIPGNLYRTLPVDATQQTQQISIETQSGAQTLTVPLPEELVGHVYPSRVSPDGHTLFMLPMNGYSTVVVWEIGTENIATTTLADSDVLYLNQLVIPTHVQFQTLVWVDNTSLQINYFDLDVAERFPHLLATKSIMIQESPFAVIVSEREEILYPALPAPPDGAFPRPALSPQGSFVTLISADQGNRFQVYDLREEPSELVADIQSNGSRRILGAPLWLAEEERFFMVYEENPGTVPIRLVLAEVAVEQSFQVTQDLMSALETVFGSETTLKDPHMLSIDPLGTRLTMRIYSREMETGYLVTYNLETQSAIALCDDTTLDWRYYYPLWGPESAYFGFWFQNWMTVYDLSTGQGYRADGRGYIGWINPTDD